MAIHAGKLSIRRVDMDEIVAFGVDLFKCFTAPLRENEMARAAVTGFDRHLAVGRNVFPVVTAETSIPILVSNKIGMRAPVDFHFREKIFPIENIDVPLFDGCSSHLRSRRDLIDVKLQRIGPSFCDLACIPNPTSKRCAIQASDNWNFHAAFGLSDVLEVSLWRHAKFRLGRSIYFRLFFEQ